MIVLSSVNYLISFSLKPSLSSPKRFFFVLPQVQTEEQYIFIHDALLEATLSGNTEISRENLAEYIEKLLANLEGEEAESLTDGNPKRFLDKHFQVRKLTFFFVTYFRGLILQNF